MTPEQPFHGSRVLFVSPELGGLSLGVQFVTRENLAALMALERPVVCLQGAEDEVEQVPLEEVEAGRRYLLVEESDLHEEDSVKGKPLARLVL